MKLSRFTLTRGAVAAALIAMVTIAHPATSSGYSLETFEEEVTEFTLENGLHFIVVERHAVPIVSFNTLVKVGSANEVKGITGLAHLFEHMAFKGTTSIGTKDFEAEQKAHAREDEIFEKIRELRRNPNADEAALEKLYAELKVATDASAEFVIQNEFDRILQEAGANGMNASTSTDVTRYYVSLPSNKIELWFSLESDRFLNPVLREFHTERQVVAEERRQRTESSPRGALFEEFLSTAFKAHPYGEPIVGHMSDIQSITREEAQEFFETYYCPSNMVITIAGDVDPAEIKELAQVYFGRLPKIDEPPALETFEPVQQAERRVAIFRDAQPILAIGYHKGSINHPDDAAYDVLSDILGRGQSSRLTQRLVKEEQIATSVQAGNGWPGNAYPNLFIIFAAAAKGHDAEEMLASIDAELRRITKEPVSEEELERAKVRAKADLIRGMDSNSGIAFWLSTYHALTGDWRETFHWLEKISNVTAEDVQRVAKETLQRENRTIAYLHPLEELKEEEEDEGELSSAADAEKNGEPKS